jgi:hypothetical protein
MTYYKYVERDASSQVNWADVSKKFSDEIARIGGERDKKRAEIDKATDELVTKINAAPKGQHQNANSFTASLVDQTTEETLRMNKLLKSGAIKPSEYMNYIENQKSSITGLYDMVTDYQTVYTDKMERARTDQSLSGEVDGMAVVEGFGNFTNITPVIDMYGNVIMVDNVTGLTLSVAEQRAITNQYFDAYDIDSVLDEEAKQLGRYVVSVMDGTVKTREDVMQEEGYSTELGALVEAALEGHLAVSTVLDKKLAGYSSSFFPSQADENDILYIPDPRQPGSGAQIPLVEVVEQVAAMGPEERRDLFGEGVDVDRLIEVARTQRKAAEDWTRGDLQTRFDMIETASTAGTTPRDTAGERGLAAQGKVNLRALEKIHGGEDKDVQEGLEHVFGKDPSYRTSRVEGSGDSRKVIVEYYDKAEKRSYTREFNIPVGLKDWIDVGAAEFYNESQIPYVYDAYENQPRLYEGVRGQGTGETRRMIVVDDLASIEVTDDAGTKASVGDRIKGLVGENAMEVFDGKGVNASANADVIRSALNTSAVGLEADVTSINEDVIEKATGKTIRRSGIRIFVPGRMDVPLVVPNSTESLASLLGILEVIASSPSVKAADLVAMLPDEAAIYNDPKVVGTAPQQTGGGAPRPSAPRP